MDGYPTVLNNHLSAGVVDLFIHSTVLNFLVDAVRSGVGGDRGAFTGTCICLVYRLPKVPFLYKSSHAFVIVLLRNGEQHCGSNPLK